jgi:M6 family metalloprotease-like protein
MYVLSMTSMSKVFIAAASMLLILPWGADAQESFSALPVPVDPESWTLPEWMTWDDYRPIPGVNWNDPARQPIKKLRSAFVLGDFSDRDFIVTMPKGADIFGLSGRHNPIDAGAIPREQVGDFYADLHVREPQALNHFHTVNEYWLEDSFGIIGVDATPFGPYRMTGKEHEYGLGGGDAGGAGDACPTGDSCGQDFDAELIQASLADVTAGIATNGEDYDFRFLLHAGYDESGVWAEFGPMMFPSKDRVADVLGNPDPTKPNWAETRYVDWSSFAAAEGIWSHAVPGVTSTQGENDGAAVFAHELSHIFGVLDNYNNPYGTPVRRAYTGPWEMLSRGSFNGPGGAHNRWQIPPTMGATMGSHHMLRNKMRLGFIKPNEVLVQPKAAITANGPVFATIYPRAYPLAPVTADAGLHGIHLLLPNDMTPACEIETKHDCDGGGYTSYTVEVVDRVGFDSFTPDHGVLIAKNIDVADSTPFEWAIDAHPEDINKRTAPPPNSNRPIFDYYRPAAAPSILGLPVSGTRVPITLGDPRQLADALFHAGTGEGVVSEFVDEPNGLHFYVLGSQVDDRGVRTYRVAVRSLAGAGPGTRGLQLEDSTGARGARGRVATARFTIKNTGIVTDLVRLSATHSRGWTTQLQHRVIELAAGASAEIPVYIAVPNDAGAADTVLRFTAASETAADVLVQAQATVRVLGSPSVESGRRAPAPSLPGTGVNTSWLAGICALALAALLNRARRRQPRRG